jgi:hypothetical protein
MAATAGAADERTHLEVLRPIDFVERVTERFLPVITAELG